MESHQPVCVSPGSLPVKAYVGAMGLDNVDIPDIHFKLSLGAFAGLAISWVIRRVFKRDPILEKAVIERYVKNDRPRFDDLYRAGVLSLPAKSYRHVFNQIRLRIPGHEPFHPYRKVIEEMGEQKFLTAYHADKKGTLDSINSQLFYSQQSQ